MIYVSRQKSHTIFTKYNYNTVNENLQCNDHLQPCNLTNNNNEYFDSLGGFLDTLSCMQ